MRFSGKYYSSIDDCPVIIFQNLMAGGDVKKLHTEGKYSEGKAFESWELIFNEYITEFGLPPAYVEYLEKMAKSVVLLANSVENKFNRTLAEIEKRKALAVINTEEGEGFNSLVKKVSQQMGFPVDPTKTSVRQFYSYVNG